MDRETESDRIETNLVTDKRLLDMGYFENMKIQNVCASITRYWGL